MVGAKGIKYGHKDTKGNADRSAKGGGKSGMGGGVHEKEKPLSKKGDGLK